MSLMRGCTAGADGERRGGCLAGLLESAVYPVEQPQLSHLAGPEVFRLQQVRLLPYMHLLILKTRNPSGA